MKKGISILLCVCLLLSILAAHVNAASEVTFAITTDHQGPLIPGTEVTFMVTMHGTSKVTHVGFHKLQFDTDVFEYIADDPETTRDEAVINRVPNALVAAATRTDGIAALWACAITLPGTLELGSFTLRVKENAPGGDTGLTATVYAGDGDTKLSADLQGLTVEIASQSPTYLMGDFSGDGSVTNEDVIYLLWHTLFPVSYPVNSPADFTKDGYVNNDDVIYFLWHTLFPESYPLN